LPGFLQALDLAKPHITATFHVFHCQAHSTICIVEFLSALAGCPLGPEGGQQAHDLFAGHAITTLVRAAARSILHTASRNGFSDNLCQVVDPVIFLGTTNIESLVVNPIARRFEHHNYGGDDVANMCDGTLGRTVALDKNATGCIGGSTWSLRTMSSRRRRGDTPEAVAFLI
jgi:hypothetical protein